MNGNTPKTNSPVEQPIIRGSKPKRYRLVAILFTILVIAIGAIIIARAYEKWAGMESVEKLAKALRQYEEEVLEKQIADTYGGKTPQETLQMYIDAVERGDYELASKYFVREKQGGEFGSLKTAPKENIDNIQNMLKEALVSEGGFSSNGKGYLIRKPILVNFVLYPNGVWKISEI